MLTLILTPALLALRVWLSVGAYRSLTVLSALSHGSDSQNARDLALNRAASRVRSPEILWDVGVETEHAPLPLADPVNPAPAAIEEPDDVAEQVEDPKPKAKRKPRAKKQPPLRAAE